METYLLDTNTISDLVNESCEFHVPCKTGLASAAKDQAHVVLSVMSIAEIEFGLVVGGNAHSEQAQDIRRFLARFQHIPFDDNTVEPYTLIRARLFEMLGSPKANRRGCKEKLPEELKDRVSGKSLGIDERDLLIVGAAVHYNFVLVTDDRNIGMKRIREAADSLVANGFHTQLRIENWRHRKS